MYLSHYNLSQWPFQMDPEQEFIWFGEKHAKALKTLKYGMQEEKGFVLLTGKKGTGKTLILETFLRNISQNNLTVSISEPISDYLDFANILSREFCLNKSFTGKGEFLIHFKKFLQKTRLQNKRACLIIDDIHKFPVFLLEDVRLLSNLDLNYIRLINIFLIGHTEFNRMLNTEDNKALQQRIGLRFQLEPLNELETGEYIDFRLRVAGSDNPIFSPDAVRQIHLFSSGCPGRINLICDKALQSGYTLGLKTIEKKVIKGLARDLRQARQAEAIDHQKINYDHKDDHAAGLSNHKSHRWGIMNFAASLLVLLLGGAYFYYNSPFDQAQYSIPTYNIYRPYQSFENRTNRTHKEQPQATANGQETGMSKETDVQKKASASSDQTKDPPQSYTIYFQDNSNTLSENNLEILLKLANSIKKLPHSAVIIEGYTDSTGNYWQNKKLSKIRANLVKELFIKNGVKAARIKALGLGSERPTESKETVMRRKLHPRVEIKIVSKDKILVLSKK